MALDLKKLDAALFCIQNYLKEVFENNGPFQDHAEYFMDMTRRLRSTIVTEAEQIELEEKTEDFGIQQGIRPSHRIQPPKHFIPRGKTKRAAQKKKRAADKGQMSMRQRNATSKSMKKFWTKKRGKKS